MVGDVVVAAVDLAARTIRPDAAGVFINDAEVVIYVPRFFTCAGLTAAGTGAPQGGLVAHRPSDLIEAVHMLFDVEIARQPGKSIPIAQLEFHLAPLGLTWKLLERLSVIRGLYGDDVSQSALQDLCKRGPHAGVIAPAQPRHDRQPLLFR